MCCLKHVCLDWFLKFWKWNRVRPCFEKYAAMFELITNRTSSGMMNCRLSDKFRSLSRHHGFQSGFGVFGNRRLVPGRYVKKNYKVDLLRWFALHLVNIIKPIFLKKNAACFRVFLHPLSSFSILSFSKLKKFLVKIVFELLR